MRLEMRSRARRNDPQPVTNSTGRSVLNPIPQSNYEWHAESEDKAASANYGGKVGHKANPDTGPGTSHLRAHVGHEAPERLPGPDGTPHRRMGHAEPPLAFRIQAPEHTSEVGICRSKSRLVIC